MSAKSVIATIAHGLALAGFSLMLFAPGTTAAGGEPASLKPTTLRGLKGERISLAAPSGGATVLIFYSTECPISNELQPDPRRLIDAVPPSRI